ncbi:hypothetical protein COO60DRAFT_1487023 [Scenedesmus sp. NREL 46B-D3]|nr:hypothetical protein COO60DRAFT_1487023 [Scenedesmus sp. NREL 46B-D3]
MLAARSTPLVPLPCVMGADSCEAVGSQQVVSQLLLHGFVSVSSGVTVRYLTLVIRLWLTAGCWCMQAFACRSAPFPHDAAFRHCECCSVFAALC